MYTIIYIMKRLIFLYVLFFFTFFIHGDENELNYLFINSTPIKAKVLINNIDKGYITPCIIKNLDNSVKTIKIVKEGYIEQAFDILQIKSKRLDVYLTSNTLNLYFPDSATYKISDITKKGPIFVSNLESGNYFINIKKDQIIVRRVSPFLPAEISLGTSLGISLIFTGITIGLSEYYNYRAISTNNDFDERHYDLVKRGYDIGKYVSISISSIIATALTGIIIADVATRIRNKKRKIELLSKSPIDEGAKLYNNSLDYLSNGEIEKSINILESLISLYPDNVHVPMAYYQLGQNYFLLKKYDNALLNWEIFINDYPVADYYDYVLKNIAEIYYMKDDYDNAIKMLNKVVFTENILDRETIFSFKAKLNLEMYFLKKDNEFYVMADTIYSSLIDSFPQSERLAYYYSQLIKLYKSEKNTDKLNILKQKADEIKDPSIKKTVLSYF